MINIKDLDNLTTITICTAINKYDKSYSYFYSKELINYLKKVHKINLYIPFVIEIDNKTYYIKIIDKVD